MTSYPKPSDIGGRLIRKLIAQLKAGEVSLPLTKPILISVSGGVDSMVLAHLLARYGRRIIHPTLVTLLHFDHGWRPESGTLEKKLVQSFAKDLGVSFLHQKLDAPNRSEKRLNLEEDGRLKRRSAYQMLAGRGKPYQLVWTAHHQDDVIETLIWRFFRGELLHQNEGILFLDSPVLRPFLQVTKEEIYEYARAEKVPFQEDPSNKSTDQFRGFARQKLIPLVAEHFPGFKKSLVRYTESAKKTKTPK